jgi:hypothetical protein
VVKGHVLASVATLGVAASAFGAAAACNSILGIKAAQLEDPLDCDNYCNVVSQNCQDTNAEYLPGDDGGMDVSLCMQMCSYFTLGTRFDYPGDAGTPSGVNTLGCRLWHAHAAGDVNRNGPMAAEEHCPHAGPLGYSVCVAPGENEIDNFCRLDVPYCYAYPDPPITVYGGASEGLPPEIETADEAVCVARLNEENTLADGGFYLYSGAVPGSGDVAYSDTNTLNCRLWHLEYAIQTETNSEAGGPPVHCPHTGDPSVNADGTPGPCVWPDGGPSLGLRRTVPGRAALCVSRVAAR